MKPAVRGKKPASGVQKADRGAVASAPSGLGPPEPACMIGLEIHVQLATQSKLFCGCPNQVEKGKEDKPNTQTCPVCLGHPGAKPVPNEKAVQDALMIALALECSIAKEVVFSRKSYFYPDMAKNFQITQFEEPLGRLGRIELDGKTVMIKRVHVEEDPASLVHAGSCVLVDYNRSGTPLVEIVTEPVLSSPDEARECMRRLLSVLEYVGVYDGSWCILKADANVSVKESGFSRVEIKNITGFREIERALCFEVARQRQAVQEGMRVGRETRGWDAQAGATYPLREKESEEDYGYIIDPDLVAVSISEGMIAKAKEQIPELSQAKAKRFIAMGIKAEDAKVLAQDREIADLFEQVAGEVHPVLAAKWIRRELMRVLNFSKKSLRDVRITKHHLVDLLKLVSEKRITDATAQKLMERLVAQPFDICKTVSEESLGAVSDDAALVEACRDALASCPEAVKDYKGGEQKALNFIVGRVMAKMRGTADPASVKKILVELMNG